MPGLALILNVVVLNPYDIVFHAIVVFIIKLDFNDLSSAYCVLHALA